MLEPWPKGLLGTISSEQLLLVQDPRFCCSVCRCLVSLEGREDCIRHPEPVCLLLLLDLQCPVSKGRGGREGIKRRKKELWSTW